MEYYTALCLGSRTVLCGPRGQHREPRRRRAQAQGKELPHRRNCGKNYLNLQPFS